VCLLDLAARVCGPAYVHALHVDHGLRDASAADADHCAAVCGDLGVALTVHRARRPDGAGNVQAWARRERYEAGLRLAEARGARLATGHTASDQAETVLYRLAASPGRRALLGMRPRDGRLVRPLLRFTREDTTTYCRARGLSWRDDETNATGRYARGRVRHQLLAALREVHPAAEANVVRSAELLRAEGDVLDALVDEILAGADSIELARLRALPAALRRLVALRLAEDAVGGFVPAAAGRVDELLAFEGRPGTFALDLAGARAVVESGVLRYVAAPGRAEALAPS
jgi:tRNA(Ile)-lysidine synthase